MRRYALALGALMVAAVAVATIRPDRVSPTDVGVNDSALADTPQTNVINMGAGSQIADQLSLGMTVASGTSTSFDVQCYGGFSPTQKWQEFYPLQRCTDGTCVPDKRTYTINGTGATGSLTHLAVASLTEGDLFTIGDGIGDVTTYRFSTGTLSHTPSATDVEVYIGQDTTATEVATRVAAAMAGDVAAEGAFTAETKANMTEGDSIVINDGVNSAVTFRFSTGTLSHTASSTDVEVDISADTTAIEVADRFRTIYAGSIKATGSYTALAKASIAEGDTFTITDPVRAYEFVFVSGNVQHLQSLTSRTVDYSGTTTAADVAAVMRTAINASAVGVVASGASSTVTLTANAIGSSYNIDLAESLASGTLTPVGMTYGTDAITLDISTDAAGNATVGLTADNTGITANQDLVVTVATGTLSEWGMIGGVGSKSFEFSIEQASAVLTFTHRFEGTVGNVSITETLASGTLTPVGMSGGADGDSNGNRYMLNVPAPYPFVYCTFDDSSDGTSKITVEALRSDP